MQKSKIITAIIGLAIVAWIARPQLEPKLRETFSFLLSTTSTKGVVVTNTPQRPPARGEPTNQKKIPVAVTITKPKPVIRQQPIFTGGGALVGPTTNAPTSEATTLSVASDITLTNQERASAGLSVLGHNTLLDTIATRRVADMFDRQYFAHNSPNGVTPSDVAKQVGYAYINFGENIALGNFASDRELVTAWMNSPHHRDNILGTNYTEIGVAVSQGMYKGENTWIAVQEFGRPQSACPPIDDTLKQTIDTETVDTKTREADLARRKTELDSLPHRTQAEITAYNQKADEYNTMTQELNALVAKLKNEIAQFNNQVNAFNACLGP
ncbi:MAG: CAP domain-containing protein [Candidatus Magasanikbacteria bacterium]|nr:CAP domain-containing protein [Candidatus Magasanikbacteria bacterium]